MDIIGHLSLDVGRSRLHNLLQHLGCQSVSGLEVLGIARRAHPAEGPEAIVEEHGSHDILDVRRIAERSVGFKDVGAGTARFEEEGITIVEEIHAFGREFVDGSHLSAEGCLYSLFELLGFGSHHLFALLEGETDGIVAPCPRVVERGLVAAQVDPDVLFGQSLPEVDHIAHISHRHHASLADCLSNGGNQLVEAVVQFVDPSLLIAFAGCLRVDLGRDAHHTGDVASLGLSARHTAESGRDEELHVVATHLTGSIEHGDGGAVNDALRPNIHI